jgi:hypothetical protein
MLFWIGNIVFIGIIIPVVVHLLNGLMRPAVEIKKYADDVLENGVMLTGELDVVPQLLTTRDLIKQVGAGANRYAAAIQQVL